MDQFDYLARARALMARTARNAALIVVPLAAAASAAHAGEVYLPTTPVSCTYVNGGTSGSCSGSASQINTDPGNGLYGVSLFTTSPVLFYSTSGGSLTLSVNGDLSGGGISMGTVIPLAYDFLVTGVSGGSKMPATWSLEYSIQSSGFIDGFTTVSGSGSATNMGTTSLTISSLIPSDADVQIVTELSWSSVTGFGDFDLSVPGNGTFDVNALSSTTPEPGTMGLLASALAWVGWRYRRRG
jgi:hypothetical protein